MVTFVFTDIQGSTQLLRRLGDDYEAVLRRSGDDLVETWSRHGGHALPSAGDSTFAAFASPDAAIAACVHGQRRLASETWPVECPPTGIRLHMRATSAQTSGPPPAGEAGQTRV